MPERVAYKIQSVCYSYAAVGAATCVTLGVEEWGKIPRRYLLPPIRPAGMGDAAAADDEYEMLEYLDEN